MASRAGRPPSRQVSLRVGHPMSSAESGAQSGCTEGGGGDGGDGGSAMGGRGIGRCAGERCMRDCVSTVHVGTAEYGCGTVTVSGE